LSYKPLLPGCDGRHGKTNHSKHNSPASYPPNERALLILRFLTGSGMLAKPSFFIGSMPTPFFKLLSTN
jgi:hypothetical protein